MPFIRQVLIFIVQSFCCVICFAQAPVIDSLKGVLSIAKDKQQVSILNEIAALYYHRANNLYDSSLSQSGIFADKALQSAQRLHDTQGIGIALFNGGNILSFKGKLSGAISMFKRALPFLNDAGESKTAGLCLKNLAECIHELGDNKQAILYYDSSFKVFQKLKDTAGLVLSLGWKGHSYFDLGDYKTAYAVGQSAYEMAQKTKDTTAQILAADHLANLFLGADMPKTVLEYMRIINRFYPGMYVQKYVSSWEAYWGLLKVGEAYIKLRQTDSAMLIAQIVGFDTTDGDKDMFLGNLYMVRREYDKALYYFRKGFQIAIQSKHSISVSRHANGLSSAYLASQKYTDAAYYAAKAAKAASSIHALLEWKNAISTLADIYDKTHDYSKAYHFSKLYKSLNDSLAPEEYKRKLALIQIQQELESQRQQAALLSKENQLQLQQNMFQKEKERKLRLTGIVVVFAVSLVACLIIINIRLKRKKDEAEKIQLQQQLNLQAVEAKHVEANFKAHSLELEMQALRAQMNPHFIFNCLNSINRFIINNDAEKAADYLTKFAKLIRIVLEQSGKSMVPLEDELNCLRLYMDLETLRFEKPFQYEIHCNGADTAKIMIPTLLIQPFVENAIWHGLQGEGDNGKINISLYRQGDILHCIIQDNGIGRLAASKGKGETEKKSWGIMLTQHRLELININNQNKPALVFNDLLNEKGESAGTCVGISIPIKEV